mgnify:CR=1 FL=1
MSIEELIQQAEQLTPEEQGGSMSIEQTLLEKIRALPLEKQQ